MAFEYEQRKLTLQLVPSSAWYSNLRSMIPNWSEVSNKVRINGKCEICGCETDKLDAHEVWKFDDENATQSLDRIIAVCKNCHAVIHFGHTQIEGDSEKALAWYMQVNNITKEQALDDITVAFDVWETRSNQHWTMDKKAIIKQVEDTYDVICDISKPIDGKYYAYVEFNDKDKAKKLGAKWDGIRRMWYFSDEESRQNWHKSMGIFVE